MQAEIVSIGNELLWGLTVNSNAAYLSRELNRHGYTVARHTAVSDHPAEIEATFKEALSRSSIVIATGGLGPTLDDLTRTAAEPFLENPEELKNSVGTAPGIFSFSNGKAIVLLPGVPKEMEAMFLNEALPNLLRHLKEKQKTHLVRSRLCLLKEVEVDPFLRELKQAHPDVEIGIFPALGSLQIVFQSAHPVDKLVQALERRYREFFLGDLSVEEALQKEMIENRKKLALAESITGGAIAARLAAIPDCSQYFLGSVVAYSNEWKERHLHVSHTTLEKDGAVSRKTVEEMVQGLLSETNADFAAAVSGIAGPSGGSEKKPVGTVYIAVGERGKKIDAGKIQAPQNRASAIELTVQTALGALWRRAAHNAFTFS